MMKNVGVAGKSHGSSFGIGIGIDTVIRISGIEP
jgi:hypothetical protein